MDPYVYPGSDILKNRRGIRDEERLGVFEADAATRRLTELQERPLTGSFDAKLLQQIHRYLFQDVYRWAGEFRRISISRSGQFPHAFPDHIEGALNAAFAQLRGEHHLASLDLGRFAVRAAHYLGEINAIHPFREGNGRAQREFIRTLADHNGHKLDWSRTSQEQMYKASRLSFQRADNSGLEAVLRSVLRQEKQAGRERAAKPPSSHTQSIHPDDSRQAAVQRAKDLAAALEARGRQAGRNRDDERER